MPRKFQKNKGFTLVEMIIVIAIIIFIATTAFSTSYVLRDQLAFRSAYSSVEGILSEARSYALSGESYTDYTDYDGDGNFDDLILPNGYIVNFVDDETPISASLYADLFSSAIGQLDTADDVFIKSVSLPENINFEIISRNQLGGDGGVPTDDFSFLYTTPGAGFEVINYLNTSMQIDIQQKDDDGETIRNKLIFVHYLYGIPELLNDAYLE